MAYQASGAGAYRSGFRAGLFDGQTVLVAGGGGLGGCIAHELAALGASLVLCGPAPATLDRTAQEIESDGGRVLGCYPVELDDEDDVVDVVAEVVDAHGPVDGLVNAAGEPFAALLRDLSQSQWTTALQANLSRSFLLAREVYRQSMEDHGGNIVSIGAGLHASAGLGHDGAARAGLASFTRSAATEWAAAGVRVNCVTPGFIAAAGLDRYPASTRETLRQLPNHIPLRRFGTAAEVSAAVVFLLSDMAAYISGAELCVDGGLGAGAGSLLFQPPEPRNAQVFDGFHRERLPNLLTDDQAAAEDDF